MAGLAVGRPAARIEAVREAAIASATAASPLGEVADHEAARLAAEAQVE